MTRLGYRGSLLLIVGVIFILLVGCSKLGFDREGSPPRIKRVILVVIDTLRADHLGSYGYPRRTSPFLDSIAEKGVLFERSIAPMASTVPSHSTLFTGLYPIQTKVMKNGHVLDSKFETLAEVLKKNGFGTMAFVSSPAPFVGANLEQGFDEFHYPDLPLTIIYQMGQYTVDKVIARLDKEPLAERLFLFVHLFDPHLPQTPPQSLFRKFREETQAGPEPFRRFLIENHKTDPASWGNVPGEMLKVMDLYDAEVRHADDHVARLIRRLEKAGAKDDTVVIVTSDHGEGLGNHRAHTHDDHRIYNETLKVPMIYYFPGRKLGKRFAGIVEHTDLFPTVMELVGLQDSASSGPVKTGRSLVDVLFSPTPPSYQRIAFSQRRQRDMTYVKESEIEEEKPFKFAVQSSEYKYIHRTDGAANELFDLTNDPYETKNLAGRGMAVEKELHDHLTRTLSELSNEHKPRIVGREEIEALRSLGYLQ